MAFPTLGYHAEWGLAPKNHNFTIAYGESYCTACGERIRVGGNDSVGCSTVPVPKPLSGLLKNPRF
jgi:hypothetical protein